MLIFVIVLVIVLVVIVGIAVDDGYDGCTLPVSIIITNSPWSQARQAPLINSDYLIDTSSAWKKKAKEVNTT